MHWYAVHVTGQHERRLVEALKARGIDAYVPVRRELHRWSDRRKWVDVVMSPNLIFVRTSLSSQRDVYVDRNVQYFICAPGDHHPSPITDRQMEDFMDLTLRTSNIELIPVPLQKGDRVRVMSGPLVGFEGELLRVAGDAKVLLRLGDLMAAAVVVPADIVERVPD